MMLNPKLIIAAGVLVALVAVSTYISFLQKRVKNLQEEVTAVSVERDTAQQQVRDITETKDQVVKRQIEMERANAKLRGDLARERGRVQQAPIPTDCKDALDWLAKELK